MGTYQQVYFLLSFLSSILLYLSIRGDYNPHIPTRFHDCAISTFASILCYFLDHVPSYLFAGNATISCFSICRILLRERLPHWISHRKPIPRLATNFLQSLHTGKASPSAAIASWPSCTFLYDSRPMFLLYDGCSGTDVTLSWSHVHDQFSLPKAKTA